jgi:hypothetical protein
VKRLFIGVAITAVVHSLVAPPGAAAKQHPTGNRSERSHIVAGPALESATDHTAIIRWTANTGRGTATHYGIVRYGTDPGRLDRTAKSPIRWNQSLPATVYRVRIEGLTPGTTYYFTVDAAHADGVSIGLKNRVDQFTTRSRP